VFGHSGSQAPQLMQSSLINMAIGLNLQSVASPESTGGRTAKADPP